MMLCVLSCASDFKLRFYLRTCPSPSYDLVVDFTLNRHQFDPGISVNVAKPTIQIITHARARARTHTHTHTHTNIHARTHRHACTHTHTRTHPHTSLQRLGINFSPYVLYLFATSSAAFCTAEKEKITLVLGEGEKTKKEYMEHSQALVLSDTILQTFFLVLFPVPDWGKY